MFWKKSAKISPDDEKLFSKILLQEVIKICPSKKVFEPTKFRIADTFLQSRGERKEEKVEEKLEEMNKNENRSPRLKNYV